MRRFLPIFVFLLLVATTQAEEALLSFVDWGMKPQGVVDKLEESRAKPTLKIFHKTGVPYVTATIQALGNSWEGTLYFDEDDNLNQVLLQMSEVDLSQVMRIQKLAVSEFGKKYETSVKEGNSRTDTNFEWTLNDKRVMVSSVRYKGKDTGLVWLKLSPALK